MDVRLLASLVLAFAASGCSFYDVATNAADAVAGTGLFSDKDPNENEWDGLWDPETSQCIRDEKKLRPILQQLDSLELRALDEGKDFVVLPTGEKYPIEKRSPSDESTPGPTSTCLSHASD